jgi:hypothetical protein
MVFTINKINLFLFLFFFIILSRVNLEATLICKSTEDCSAELYNRLKLDFTIPEFDLFQSLGKYIKNLKIDDIKKWEKNYILEYKIFNNEKYYFKESIPNFFRLNKENLSFVNNPPQKPNNTFPLSDHINDVINKAREEKNPYVLPVTFKIKYTIVVEKDVIPSGEIIRCWIPFPRKIEGKQSAIKILVTEPKDYILASNKYAQRTIYFEKKSMEGVPTTFHVEYQFTSFATYMDIDSYKIKNSNLSEKLIPYVQEEPPHIVFTQHLKYISKKIVGEEKNPYKIAQKLFKWVYVNIPWASAREYSTIKNISEYALKYRHGDCGIKTLLFMTLCRYNKIPARWQSGWEFQPPHDSMHDWCEIYIEPYGWIPVDVTYGLRKSRSRDTKWFYLGGLDSYRLVFNNDMGQELYPLKIYMKSDTVDSQRGEVEWRGGNLYYDKWNYIFDWEIVQ